MFLNSLSDIFVHEIRTAAAADGKQHEAVCGIVTDNKDPSKLGRVRVKVPILSDTDITWWAPIVMLGAGKNRGWFFIPEKDDEVLVMFEHGDFQRPIVVGALWNSKDKVSGKNPGGVPTRHIKSRSGSMFVFDDENGKIEIYDKTNGKITFDASANKITLEALVGDVCIQAPKGDIKIVAKEMAMKTTNGNIEVVAGTDMQWGTDTAMKVDGGPSVVWGSGANNNQNPGGISAPSAPTATPADVEDPRNK